jgi:hypothetical protein
MVSAQSIVVLWLTLPFESMITGPSILGDTDANYALTRSPSESVPWYQGALDQWSWLSGLVEGMTTATL